MKESAQWPGSKPRGIVIVGAPLGRDAFLAMSRKSIAPKGRSYKARRGAEECTTSDGIQPFGASASGHVKRLRAPPSRPFMRSLTGTASPFKRQS